MDDKPKPKQEGIKLYKGNIGNVQMYSWNVINDCTLEECPIFIRCKHDKSHKCGLMYTFMRSINNVILRNYDDISEPQLNMIGLQLMPLYRVYCQLLIHEAALRNDYFRETTRGEMKTHPVLQELRNASQAIFRAWREMGLTKWGNSPPLGELPLNPGDDEDGQGNRNRVKRHEAEEDVVDADGEGEPCQSED